MAEMIEVIIDEEGGITSTVKGVKGKSCAEVDQFITDLGNVKGSKKTKEYYQNAGDTRKKVKISK